MVYLYRQFFCHFRKKVLDQNGPYISTIQTILRNVCLTVILEFSLPSSVCVFAPAYTSLCRGLQYLVKVRYIILVDGTRFLIFEAIVDMPDVATSYDSLILLGSLEISVFDTLQWGFRIYYIWLNFEALRLIILFVPS